MAGEDLQGQGGGPSASELDAATRANETRHTKATAQNLAGIMAMKMKETEPEPAGEDDLVVQPHVEGIEADEGVEYVTVEVDPTTGEEEVTYIDEEVPLDEIAQALAEVGIVLDVDPAELPDEALGVYENLASAAIQAAGKAREREMEAQERMLELNEFSDRLQKAPDKIMLAIAMENPELWTKVAGVVERMNEDPSYKEVVVRELESEVRLQEAQRIERVKDIENRTMQGRRVAQETLRQAKRYGVSAEVANEFISSAVRSNQNWLEVSEVEPLIKKLAGGDKKKIVVRKVRPKKVSPEAQAAAAQANTAPVGGSAPAGVEQKGPSPGLKFDENPKNRGGRFRGLVKQAARRVASIQE